MPRQPPEMSDRVSTGPDIERYLARLEGERGYSARTIASYRLDLEALRSLVDELRAAGRGRGLSAQALAEGRWAADSRALRDDDAADWAIVDERAVRAWVAGAARRGLSARTIARRLSAWRGFYDWLAESGAGTGNESRASPGNPARGVRAPRAPRRLPSALAPDQAVRLVDDPRAEGFDALRDRAIFELLYSSGLRLSELVGLDVRYFDAGGGDARSTSWLELDLAQVTVTGKGAKRRMVPVGTQACEALAVWLAERDRFLAGNAQADSRALFLSSRGARVSARTIQARLARRGIVQGIPAKVHPHMLRHSFASHLLQSSGDLRAVQELLGHASITSTQVYTALDFQRLAAVYDAAHPRARRASRGPASAGSKPDDAPGRS